MMYGHTITEDEMDIHLTAQREAQPGYIGPSFPTIAGCNGNGAIIHYRAQKATAAMIDKTCMLLVDSGGQYDCGTTDITRTFHFGEPTSHQKACYTRVLQVCILVLFGVFVPGVRLQKYRYHADVPLRGVDFAPEGVLHARAPGVALCPVGCVRVWSETVGCNPMSVKS